MSNRNNEGLSRRSFLGAGGAMAAGTLVAALRPTPAEAQVAPPAGAWPIPKLDLDSVRDAACLGYWANDPYKKTNYGCAYGVASALIAGIKAGLGPGSPWEMLPLEMFKWGKTGAVESGTLCGALAGAMPIFTLASPQYVTEMGADLIRWYQEAPLPSTAMDSLAPNLKYRNQPSSVSGSPLCHVSVSKWCKVASKLAGSADRKTRCGKLSGDVAWMAAYILNTLVPGQKYVSIYSVNGQPPEQPDLYKECVHCHVDAPPPPTPEAVRNNNALGITNCVTCHPDSQPVMKKR